MWHYHLRCAAGRALSQKRHPAGIQERHVATHDHVPFASRRSPLRVQQCGDNSAKRPLGRPEIFNNRCLEICIFFSCSNDPHVLRKAAHQFDHSRQQRFPRKFNERLVAPKSRASPSRQYVCANSQFAVPRAHSRSVLLLLFELCVRRLPRLGRGAFCVKSFILLRSAPAPAVEFPTRAASPANSGDATQLSPPSVKHSTGDPPTASSDTPLQTSA